VAVFVGTTGGSVPRHREILDLCVRPSGPSACGV
jgi:hypothetical protein